MGRISILPEATDRADWTALVVDDEASVRELLKDRLELESGLTALTAATRAEAEQILATRPVTLLVSDLLLGDDSGVDVIRTAHSVQPEIISILITAHPTVETAITALQCGASDYLIKPFKLEDLALTVRRALEKGRLRRENMQLREQVAVSELIRAIGSTLEIDQLLSLVTSTVRREFKACGVAILMGTGSSDRVELKALDGDSESLQSPQLREFLHGRTPATSSVLATGLPVVFGGGQTDMFEGDDPIQELICQPLIAKGHTIGVLNIVRRANAEPCSQGTLRSIEMTAAQAAVAIETSRLYQDLNRSYMDTVSALANAIEFRDPYTRGHTDRVKILAQSIARRMGWGVEQLFDLWMGCTLHDIGKIGVPDSILNKPGPLTSQEMTWMRRHTEFGVKMIEDVPFLKPAVPYVYYHHERYDGSGYPTGLRGTDIPIEGRILAVVDAFDAVTSDRPYRKGRTLDEARRELSECSGTQFDPAVVSVFLRVLEESGENLITGTLRHASEGFPPTEPRRLDWSSAQPSRRL